MRIKIVIAFLALFGAIAIHSFIYRPVSIPKHPIILGHGGMGIRSIQPLNSEASLLEAISYPIDGTELDVRMTADCVLVALHDNDLSLSTSCSGSVSSKRYSELIECINSTWLNSSNISSIDSLFHLNEFDKGPFL